MLCESRSITWLATVPCRRTFLGAIRWKACTRQRPLLLCSAGSVMKMSILQASSRPARAVEVCRQADTDRGTTVRVVVKVVYFPARLFNRLLCSENQGSGQEEPFCGLFGVDGLMGCRICIAARCEVCAKCQPRDGFAHVYHYYLSCETCCADGC